MPDPGHTTGLLPDPVKQEIQLAYSRLIETYDFTPRFGQRQMIAEIANTLATAQPDEADQSVPPPVCVVEAGTGTGKTLAYLVAVLPLARMLGRKVVLSTATVALQEQVILKDLPEILKGSALSFDYGMAKGRGRYLCLARLDAVLQNSASLDALMDLYGDRPDIGMSGRNLLRIRPGDRLPWTMHSASVHGARISDNAAFIRLGNLWTKSTVSLPITTSSCLIWHWEAVSFFLIRRIRFTFLTKPTICRPNAITIFPRLRVSEAAYSGFFRWTGR